jgi:hypothetical protein
MVTWSMYGAADGLAALRGERDHELGSRIYNELYEFEKVMGIGPFRFWRLKQVCFFLHLFLVLSSLWQLSSFRHFRETNAVNRV